jgi:hypothetical protein
MVDDVRSLGTPFPQVTAQVPESMSQFCTVQLFAGQVTAQELAVPQSTWQVPVFSHATAQAEPGAQPTSQEAASEQATAQSEAEEQSTAQVLLGSQATPHSAPLVLQVISQSTAPLQEQSADAHSQAPL